MKRLSVILVLCILILSACGRSGNTDYSDLVSVGDVSRQSSETTVSSDIEESSLEDVQEETTTDDESLVEDSGEEAPTIIKLVVPEGYTLARIGMRLEELGVCTVDEFIEVAQTGDFSSYPLVAEQTYNSERCFKLEGYLFPDTYEIYTDESPNSIIRKMLSNNERKYTEEIRSRVRSSGYTFDEILTVASIVQKEGYERNDNPVPLELPKIASVLYNRLNTGMKLQCNVTATYVKGVLREFTTEGDRYNYAYNTYDIPALPAGPICNPSMDAVLAAISPADTDYLFFITDSDKNFYYAETWEEHTEFVANHLKDDVE